MHELSQADCENICGGLSAKTLGTLVMLAAVCPPLAIGAQVGYIANK